MKIHVDDKFQPRPHWTSCPATLPYPPFLFLFVLTRTELHRKKDASAGLWPVAKQKFQVCVIKLYNRISLLDLGFFKSCIIYLMFRLNNHNFEVDICISPCECKVHSKFRITRTSFRLN